MRVGIAALSVGARLKERRGGRGRKRGGKFDLPHFLLSFGSLPFGRGSRVTSRRSRVNGRGSKNPPQLFLNFFSI